MWGRVWERERGELELFLLAREWGRVLEAQLEELQGRGEWVALVVAGEVAQPAVEGLEGLAGVEGELGALEGLGEGQRQRDYPQKEALEGQPRQHQQNYYRQLNSCPAVPHPQGQQL